MHEHISMWVPVLDGTTETSQGTGHRHLPEAGEPGESHGFLKGHFLKSNSFFSFVSFSLPELSPGVLAWEDPGKHSVLTLPWIWESRTVAHDCRLGYGQPWFLGAQDPGPSFVRVSQAPIPYTPSMAMTSILTLGKDM